MEFSGLKQKAINLIGNADKEADLRQALKLFGSTPDEIEKFIVETKAEKHEVELSGKRDVFLKDKHTAIALCFDEVTADDIASLEGLTEVWTRMPTFTIGLQRIINVVENMPDVITFSWNIDSKFSGGGGVAKPASTSTETNGNRKASVKPPEPYKSWTDVASALIPDIMKAYNATHNNKGFNARRAVRDALSAGTITLSGITSDMLT